MKTLIWAVLFSFTAITAQAQTIHTGSGSIIGDVCVGTFCTNAESFTDTPLRLKKDRINLQFEDISSSSFPNADWAIKINDNGSFGSGGTEHFTIQNLTDGTDILRINDGAPDNALFIGSNGDVGLGTNLPNADFHLVTTGVVNLRIESSNLGGYWDLNAGTSGLFFTDRNTNNDVLRLSNNAPGSSVYVAPNGDVGLGLTSPDGKLHTSGPGVQLAYFESSNGGPVQVRFRTDSENRRFLATNNADEVQSQIIFLDDRINFTGTTDSGADLWLSIGPNGITSQGPTCGSPCDLTFDPEHFTVPPIAERAAYMWDNMHLPAIGPTDPETPINLTEKTGGIIHELEVAHIYIEQLHSEMAQMRSSNKQQIDAMLASLEAQKTLNRELLTRLEALEAQ